MSLFLQSETNRPFITRAKPQRIVSLVPSQTELLFDLGLGEEVVGITKFCIHPGEWFHNKQRVGGTKTVNIEQVKQLQPDLILANKEENVKEQLDELSGIAPVWVSEISTLDDALEMIGSVGRLVGKEEPANSLINKISAGFNSLIQLDTKPATAYFIWREPFMAAGGDTFISNMMQRCGLRNILQDVMRYPVVEISDSKGLNISTGDTRRCDLLLLSSEPYPFKQRHIEELRERLPQARILLVDGEMFSWYGSRLLLAVKYFEEFIGEVYRKV